MPTSQVKRTIVLQSSFNATPVSSLSVTMDASFTTAGATTNKFEDNSADATEEKTKYRMKFLAADGTEIGQLTLRLAGKGEPGTTGVAVEKTLARSEFIPTLSRGSVLLLDPYAASFERIWKQAALDERNSEYVDNVNKLDMRVTAAAGYTVGQTVRTQTDGELAIAYSWLNANGAAVVTGVVSLESVATAGADYHLGIIRVADNNPTTSEERRR